MQAEFEYETNNFVASSNHALMSLKLNGGSVLLFSLLGKCFLKLKNYKNATRCFEKAHELSPTNIDRILTLVDLKDEAGQSSEAIDLMEDAKKVDATRPDVVETQVRMALKNNDTEAATDLFKTLNSLTGVVGMINNDAVSKIHSGKFEDGVKLYQEAIKSLPKEAVELRESVTYNLALAYARSENLAKCLEVLNTLTVEKEAKIFEKYNSFKTRVKHSVMHSNPLELNKNKEEENLISVPNSDDYTDTFEEIEKKNDIKKGSRCCFKIYVRIESGEL
jgi:tetratricopeptide (TPR) repeat protein